MALEGRTPPQADSQRLGWRSRAWIVLLLLVGFAAPLVAVRAFGGEGEEGSSDLYVGSQVCQNCHLAEHELWSGSSHRHTFERATAETLPGAVLREETVLHPPGQSRYRHIKGAYVVETLGPDGKVAPFALTHVVGRMRVRMFVATLPDGRMQVLPGMLEVPTERWFDYTRLLFGAGGTDWDKAPLVEAGDPSFWTGTVRSWDARCASCHVSGYEARRPDPAGRGPRYRSRAPGIDCETCHGPGAEHVDFRESKMEGDDPMLRFSELAHDRALGVCLQCHMEAEVVDSHYRVGADIFEYRDPTLLVDPERVDPSGRSLELIYGGLAVSTSRCVQQGKLTCISCHDPHGSSNPSQLREDPQNDSLCLGCHEDVGKGIGAHTRHAAAGEGSRCVNCHMPFLEVERGHGVVADHSISIPRFDLVGDRIAQNACAWCHQGGVNAPGGAPAMKDAELADAHARWWPEGAEAKPWMQAIGKARRGDADAAAGLLALLADKGQARVIRASAVELLGQKAKEAPLALLGYARDADSLVRRRAVAALAVLDGESVDRALVRALSDDSRAVRIAAARAALEGWARVRKNGALLEALLPVLVSDAEDGPSDDMRWFRLGAARSIAGDIPGALQAYERVLELDPFAESVRKEIVRLRKLH